MHGFALLAIIADTTFAILDALQNCMAFCGAEYSLGIAMLHFRLEKSY